MPGKPMDKMSEITKVGPDRCAMVKPMEGTPKHKWLGRFAQGSERIRILLGGGWVIVDDPRNHLTNDYGQDSKEKVPAVVGLDPVKTKTKKVVEVQERRKPGRPRKPVT